MISSIVKVIEQSTLLDKSIISVDSRFISLSIESNCIYKTERACLSDTIGQFKPDLSEAWVAAIVLLFTVFDGFLENKYSLTEGMSFKNRYDSIPFSSDIEKIEKDCYRILKLIRNGVQHNLSKVAIYNGVYSFSYKHAGTNFELEVNTDSMKCLHTIVINSVNEMICGLAQKYCTEGHYIGAMNSFYYFLRKGVIKISDDIGVFYGNYTNQYSYDSSHLRTKARYIVENPPVLSEDDEKVIFKHIENNATNNESDSNYHFSTDYVYNEYILPQEMGTIKKDMNFDHKQNQIIEIITFFKEDITDIWKMKI